MEAEVYPLEQRVAESNEIDPAEVESLFEKAHAAGCSMLNMPSCAASIARRGP